MRVKHFLNSLENERVHRAIRAAEEGTSGDVVVHISNLRVNDPVAIARSEFKKLGLDAETKTASLLIFLAPKSKKFAVVGGADLHEKVGQAWWDELAALLAEHFKAGRYTDGLEAAIQRAGTALKHHFPATAVDRTGEKDIVED